MGFLGFGKKKEGPQTEDELILSSAQNPEIVVPDHAKPAAVVEEKKLVLSKKNLFRVEMVYDIGTQVMLSGAVESGLLKKSLKTKIRDKQIPISDLKSGTQSIKEISAGSSGTIFLRGKDLNILRAGDVLEFK